MVITDLSGAISNHQIVRKSCKTSRFHWMSLNRYNQQNEWNIQFDKERDETYP
jgi:hypothetical protein